MSNSFEELFAQLFGGGQLDNGQLKDCTDGKPKEIAVAFFMDGSQILLPNTEPIDKPTTMEEVDNFVKLETELWQPLRDLPKEKLNQFDMIVRYTLDGKHMHVIPTVEEINSQAEELREQIRQNQTQNTSTEPEITQEEINVD